MGSLRLHVPASFEASYIVKQTMLLEITVSFFLTELVIRLNTETEEPLFLSLWKSTGW